MSCESSTLVAALVGGALLGTVGRLIWSLVRRLFRASPPHDGLPSLADLPEGEDNLDLMRKVYLEPKRAKELLRELERKKEQTLSEIDARYADRRRDFLAYLDGQREQIVRDLKRRQQEERQQRTDTHQVQPGPTPDGGKNPS